MAAINKLWKRARIEKSRGVPLVLVRPASC